MSDAVYLIQGDPFLTEEALDRVLAESGADAFSVLTFDSASEQADVMNALMTRSLLGDRRVVVVHDAHDLPKAAVESLLGYVESPSPDIVLVLIAHGRTPLDKAVRASGTVLSLEAPRGRRLVSWIRERGRVKELKVDDRGAWAMIDSVGPELRDLDGALDQLVTAHGPGSRVGVAEVRHAFPRAADERIFALTDALGERRLDKAMTALRRLLDQGEEPLVVFGSIAAHFRKLIVARRVSGGGAKAVADALGMPSWRAEKMERQARSYREEDLVHAMGVLAEADLEMKGGDLPPPVALERAVVHIVEGVPSPTR